MSTHREPASKTQSCTPRPRDHHTLDSSCRWLKEIKIQVSAVGSRQIWSFVS